MNTKTELSDKDRAEGQSRLNAGLGDGITFDSFMTEMQRLEDERDPIGARDRRDAKRYRWLKTASKEQFLLWRGAFGCSDESIDAAMLESPNV